MTRTLYAKFYENGIEVLPTNISNIAWTITALDGISTTNMASIKSQTQIDGKCTIIASNDIKLSGNFQLNVTGTLSSNMYHYSASQIVALKTM